MLTSLLAVAIIAGLDMTVVSTPQAFDVPMTTLNFQPLITNAFYEQQVGNFTLDGTSFISDGGYLDVRAAGALRSAASLYGPLNGFIGVDLAPGTTAVGTNLSEFYGVPGLLTVDYVLGNGHTGSEVFQGESYVGLESSVGITSVSYSVTSNPGDYPVLDTFSVSTSAVPEPSTIVMFTTGLLAILWRSK